MFVAQPMTPEQLEALALTTYIDELNRRLENHEYEVNGDEDVVPRPPSPPPEYDRFGKRTNTREHRLARELEVERTLAVYRALELIPGYIPPPSLTKITRSTEKFYLPVREHPEINFVGLLLGPRGNNLRHMESESGAKISIRGRGSVKEGSASAAHPGNEEELHCVVTAISLESIHRALDLIQNVVDTAIQTPEHQNDFKRLQLRELAELNGTLRNYENQLCSYCHQPGHRKFACPLRSSSESERNSPISEASLAPENLAAVEDFLADINGADDGPGESQVDDRDQAAEGAETASTQDHVDENQGHPKEAIEPSNPSKEATKQEALEAGKDASRQAPQGPPGLTSGELSSTLPPTAPPGISFGTGSLAPPPAFMIPKPPPVAFKSGDKKAN